MRWLIYIHIYKYKCFIGTTTGAVTPVGDGLRSIRLSPAQIPHVRSLLPCTETWASTTARIPWPVWRTTSCQALPNGSTTSVTSRMHTFYLRSYLSVVPSIDIGSSASFLLTSSDFFLTGQIRGWLLWGHLWVRVGPVLQEDAARHGQSALHGTYLELSVFSLSVPKTPRLLHCPLMAQLHYHRLV